MRKTREELYSQQPIVLKMIENSFRKKRVAHAYILEGDKGTGKKDTSLFFAKAYFCVEPEDEFVPCNSCNNCRRIDSGNHPDLHVIEPDGLSIKKWQIQELQEEFSKTGVESNKKLYIIEHADRMTPNAANSLLKFLEEPNSQTVALLLTEQVHRMLDTILSRCQSLSFKPLSARILRNLLIQDKGVSQPLASLVSQVTNDLNDAYQLSQDEWFGQSRAIVLQLSEVLYSRPVDALFLIQDKWLSHFKEKTQLDLGLSLLLLLYRDLIQIQIGDEENVVYIDQIDELKQRALQTSSSRVSEQVAVILEAKQRLNTNMNPHLLMEQLVLKLQEG
ncbi:DNA polymerase III subunit delta' [Litchfieldia salsa]|uniref:DNA polymerase III subunit delta' n=1 Tax=Litchfieldia salsa TaxID=930152 RepID=A0A1H0WZM2_9BACI|nr:DNA polymerase III subunit delta' [Litchfieldia salsa]SDP96112.1 DNA polymerase-3 subunit delta' [Litchfieldia salsa]